MFLVGGLGTYIYGMLTVRQGLSVIDCMGILLREIAAQFHQPLCKFAAIQAAAGWRTARGRTRSGKGRVETGRP